MQPDEQQDRVIDQVIDAWKDEPGALLPVLHAVQAAVGCVPPGVVPRIARALNLSRAEVHGVISFYHTFRSTPPGRHVVQICRAESCQAMGARALEDHARARLGVDYGETTPDGQVTLEAVYCLGNCGCSPSLRIDDDVIGRVDADRFDRLLAELASPP